LPPFDPKKDAINQKKHGLSLAFGEKVIADPHAIELIDDRIPYGEDRWNILGMVEGKVYVTTYTDRDDGVRYISVQAADKRQTNLYFERKPDV